MKTSLPLALAAAALLGAASGAWAAAEHGHGHAVNTASGAPAVALTGGEVRKVDTAQRKVTIRHEPIANLDMPAMTMVFRADPPELLKDLKAGVRVRFRAESVDGALVVTRIEAAK